MLKTIATVLACLFLFTGAAYADHPLITDEAETLDKGEVEIEASAELSYYKEKSNGITTKEREFETELQVQYGIIDNLEVELEVPYRWVREEVDGESDSRVNGIGDMELSLKWRFYEEDDLHIAVKPFISIPTGNSDKGLGNGKTGSGLRLEATKEFDPLHLAFHLNLGYSHNEYDIEEDKENNRKDLWHASLAVEKGIVKRLKAVMDLGIERNSKKGENTPSGFIIGGLVYSVTKQINVDFGIKGGFNDYETDIAYLTGIVMEF